MSELSPNLGPATGIRIGNDVVDLQHPRCRTRPPDDRLPRRILSSAEQAWLQEAPDEPGRLRRLWSLWAAKETAFKVVSKLRGTPPVFRHRAFRCDLSEKRESRSLVHLEGTVRWDPSEDTARPVVVRVEGVATDHFVHLVGWNDIGQPNRPPCLEAGVEGRSAQPIDEAPRAHTDIEAPSTPSDPEVTPGRENESPAAARSERRDRASDASRHSPSSRGPLSIRARRVARARLASYLTRSQDEGGPEPDIRIRTSETHPGRTPPRVVVDGRLRPDLDLSLSHHGRYVGWAFLVPPELRATGIEADPPDVS